MSRPKRTLYGNKNTEEWNNVPLEELVEHYAGVKNDRLYKDASRLKKRIWWVLIYLAASTAENVIEPLRGTVNTLSTYAKGEWEILVSLETILDHLATYAITTAATNAVILLVAAGWWITQVVRLNQIESEIQENIEQEKRYKDQLADEEIPK